MASSSTTRILLIEDDPQFIDHVKDALLDLDVELEVSMTGKDGLRRLKEGARRPQGANANNGANNGANAGAGAIDIVIVDGLLPDKTGLRIIEEIHAFQLPCKVVFLSAFYTDVRSFRKLTALGVDLVLQKPIGKSNLQLKLKPFLPDAPVKRKTMETDFTSEFNSLKEDYVEKLQLVWAPKFEKLVARAQADDISAIAEIRVFCHKVSGAAGIYKQDDIGNAAKLLELGVDQRELSRLVPEMKEFLQLLRDANPKGAVDDKLSLAMRFRSALVVSASSALFTRVHDELAMENVTSHHAVSLAAALQGILYWQPDVLVVDTELVDPYTNTRAIHALAQHMTGLRMLAMGSEQSLPIGVVRIPESNRNAITAALAAPTLQPFAGNTLLLCDETRVIQEFVERLFPPLGITVEIVDRPDDYFADLETLRPGIVLMDAAFSANGGIELYEIARREHANRDVPTIFLSAQTTLAERSKAYHVGAAGYILKPLAAEQVVREVTRWLRETRVSRFARSLLRL